VAVVVDASVLLVATLADPRRARAEAALRAWLAADEALHAPALLPYEVASGLTRAVAAGALPADRVTEVWQALSELAIALHPVAGEVPTLVAIARRLQRQSAYDAAYLALGQQLDADLWTFDAALARNAAALGYRVRLVE